MNIVWIVQVATTTGGCAGVNGGGVTIVKCVMWCLLMLRLIWPVVYFISAHRFQYYGKYAGNVAQWLKSFVFFGMTVILVMPSVFK